MTNREIIRRYGAELDRINERRVSNNQIPITWETMPKQETLVHLFGWDAHNVHIDVLLTPAERKILERSGYEVTNALKSNVALLRRVRVARKNARRVL